VNRPPDAIGEYEPAMILLKIGDVPDAVE